MNWGSSFRPLWKRFGEGFSKTKLLPFSVQSAESVVSNVFRSEASPNTFFPSVQRADVHGFVV